ncbi:MAG TPA: hypothetical protein VF742_03990 [Terracidiphilus sp.]|jgi:hypothetical protein
MPRLFEGINFPKVITILAAIFGVSLGLCGLTAILSNTRLGQGGMLFGLGMIELATIILSAVGLVIMTILWVVSAAFGSFGTSADSQKLFDDSDKEQK